MRRPASSNAPETNVICALASAFPLLSAPPAGILLEGASLLKLSFNAQSVGKPHLSIATRR